MIHPERRRENLKKIEEMDREKAIVDFETIINICKEDGCDFVDLSYEAAECFLALLKEQQQQIWELQDLTEYLKDKLKEKKKPIEDFGMFAYKKHFKGELSAENLAFINLWISKYMEQT